jgi:hypothetical protein
VLDILTTEDMHGIRRSAEEVFAYLGLVKHPPAVYLSGRAELKSADASKLQMPSSFIALAPKSFARVTQAHNVRTVLTVENLTVFHQLAAGRAGCPEAHLILFTAGMPAPSFTSFYERLLQELGDRDLYHWGDIDPGGFRMAACLARAAARVGRRLSLWQMDWDREPDADANRICAS